MRRSGFWLALAALLIASSACAGTSNPASPAIARSAPAAMQIDLMHGWAFKPDPSGSADWSSPDLNDSAWDVLDVGDFWQNQGYSGYAGVAWYRRWVDVPAGWQGKSAYLAVGGVNDEYWVYVDGQEFGHVGDQQTRQSAIQRPTATPVQLTPGRPNLIAVRVRSWYNFGGIAHGPVALTTAPSMPPSTVDQAIGYARGHPQGVWPDWMSGQGHRWTVVGLPEGGPQSLEGAGGGWEATSTSPSVTAFVFDQSSRRLLRPAHVSWSLFDGNLPIAQTSWQEQAISLSTQLWQTPADRPGPGWSSLAQWRVRVRAAASGDLTLVIALRPYQVQPGVAPLFAVSWSGHTVLANGQPALVAQELPDRVVAATGEMGDVSELLAADRWPGTSAAEDASGRASLALAYDLHLQAGAERTFAFAAPIAPPVRDPGPPSSQPRVPQVDAGSISFPQPQETAARWRSILRSGRISLPDQRVTDAYYASLAYILMSDDQGALHPGPLLHDAFWYRDSTYMIGALERNGNLAGARRLLAAFVRFQDRDGAFPANVSSHTQVGHPRGLPEWDAQGEGIHALVEYFRFSHDASWLRANWPAIDSAAQWLERLRDLGQDGLLPPGESAEDLGGGATQRHYWDDFWAAIGFRDATYAAEALGETSAAQRYGAEGQHLLAATMAAAQPVIEAQGIIPNGPKDAISPASARGSTPAVWPGQLLAADVAGPIFKNYFDRFVRPYGGGFRHANDNFWPFGGLELAHAALYLGMPDETNLVLDWQLAHQTAEGVYAWGDEVSQDGHTLIGGDMPHGWTAAEYASLVRDMLLYESGDRLQIAAGVRREWLAPGQDVSVTDMPTYFGWVSYQLRRAGPTVTLDLAMDSPPPGGYDLRLPFPVQALSLDGAPFHPAAGPSVHLPPSTRHAEIRIAG